MSQTIQGETYAVVIGDVVRSTERDDQRQLLDAVGKTLVWVNEQVSAAQPLRLTIGDEFQGAYRSVNEALAATLLTSLKLREQVEIRFGIGWGAITSYDPQQAPLAQSGPAWWKAREAIDWLARAETQQKRPRTHRTRFAGPGYPSANLVNAFLMCRDHIVADMDEKDARITIGLFHNETQAELAEALRISQPSVSRRQAENGPITLYRAQRLVTD